MASLRCAFRVASSFQSSGRNVQFFSSVTGQTTDKDVPYQKTLKKSHGKGPTMTLPDSVDVVVVGGGSIGCQTIYHLAKMGLTNTVLLERDCLTSGTTWHTAGKNKLRNDRIETFQGLRRLPSRVSEPLFSINLHLSTANNSTPF